MCMRPANNRRRYRVTLSLIGWAHAHNDPCWRPRKYQHISLLWLYIHAAWVCLYYNVTTQEWSNFKFSSLLGISITYHCVVYGCVPWLSNVCVHHWNAIIWLLVYHQLTHLPSDKMAAKFADILEDIFMDDKFCNYIRISWKFVL